jgi:UDP-N-acetylmuramoyl-tripeptide--D-alanyl-D-alanine ligase
MAALAADLGIRVIAVAAPDYGGEQAASADEALDRLGPVGPGDAVLVKGSRAAGLEVVAGTLATS